MVTVSALVFEIIQVKVRSRAHSAQVDTTKICFPTGYDRRLALLLTWVQTVVSQFGASVKNYHASFADGSVLCYLICHYLPSYMEPKQVYIADTTEAIKEEISRHSSIDSGSDVEEFESDDDDMDLKQFGVYSGKGWMERGTFKKHRAGILQNFGAVFSVMRALGGIPETISAMDFEEQGPDETAVILYVSHMCARLLQVSREERAALTIQRMWKIYKGYADPIELIELEAAKKRRKNKKRAKESRDSIGSQFTAFEYHRQRYSQSRTSSSSGGTVFSGFDSTYIEIDPKDVETVVRLQARARGSIVRRQFLQLKKAVQTIENHQPMIRDRTRYLRNLRAAKTAANRIRAEYLRHVHSEDFKNKRAAAVVIQSHWRRHSMQKRYRQMKEAVEVLKARMKEMKEKKEAERAAQAATCIQATWRGFAQHHHFLKMRSGAIIIQSAFRNYTDRKNHRAAVAIQSTYRMHIARKHYETVLAAVRCLQSWARMWLQRKEFEAMHQAAIEIQAQYRAHLWQSRFCAQRNAVLCIQATYRMHIARKQFQGVVAAVICLQSWARMWLQRKEFQEKQRAATTIQAAYRARLLKQESIAQQRAAITIQTAYRKYIAHKSHQLENDAATRIQSQWRTHVAQTTFRKQKAAALTLQTAVRMHQSRSHFHAQKSAAVQIQRWFRSFNRDDMRHQHRAAAQIQSTWRAYKEHQNYQKLKQSAVTIQRAVRLHQTQQWLDDVEARLSTILVDFVHAMEHTHEVVKATIIIQAYARGALVRKQSRMLPSEIRNVAKERLAVQKIMNGYRGYQFRQKLAKRAAATAVVQNWLPTMKARHQFLRQRNAAILIQRAWRRYQTRKEQAAIVIQRAFRASKVDRQQRRLEAAAVRIQSAWKGFNARTNASKNVKKAVNRLKSAKKRAQEDPSKTLASKCRLACHTVKTNTNVEQVWSPKAHAF